MTIDYRAETLSFVPVAYRPVNVMGDMMSMMMALMQDPTKKPAPRVHSPGGLFGFRVDKDVKRTLTMDGTAWTSRMCLRARRPLLPG